MAEVVVAEAEAPGEVEVSVPVVEADLEASPVEEALAPVEAAQVEAGNTGLVF